MCKSRTARLTRVTESEAARRTLGCRSEKGPRPVPGFPRQIKPRPHLSVVLCVTDGLEATVGALQSVLDSCAIAGRIEVIVVDNGSTDGTHAVLTELSDDVQVARLAEPVPPRAAWMQGASMATGQLILFLSNDVRLRVGFLMPLRSLAEGGSGAAPILRSMDRDRSTGSHDVQSGFCMLMVRADLATGRPLTVAAVRESVVTHLPES